MSQDFNSMRPDHRRPRVAWVMHSIYNAKFFLIPHFRMLSEEHEVILYVRNDAPEITATLDIPVRIIEIPIVRHVNPLADLRALWCLYRYLRRDKPDLLHSTTAKGGLIGMLAGYLARIPRRVHTFQGEIWPHFTGIKRKLFRFLDWLVARLATEITVVSASERDFLRSESVLRPTQGIVLGAGSISGVDLNKFQANPIIRNQIRSNLQFKFDDFVFLYLGRLQKDKGLNVLKEAFSILRKRTNRSFRLLTVGPDEDGLGEELKISFGNDIRVLPYTDRPQDFISASDVLVLPSFREGFGMVLIEAAAMGVPSVASRIYGITCAVSDGETGLLFEVGNARAMSDALEQILSNDDLRLTLAKNGIHRVESLFEQSIVIDHFRHFYKDQFVNFPNIANINKSS